MTADGPLFRQGDLSWEVFHTWPYLLTGMRALLMQLAHPSVAAGVAEFSDYRRDPFGRLHRTMEVMGRIGIGEPAEADRALAELRSVHRRVVGRTPDGRAYSAGDLDLQVWVFATLIDSVIELDRRYLHRFGPEGRRRYYRESLRLAGRLRLPLKEVPGSLEAFDDYVRQQIGGLMVTGQAREVAHGVLHPDLPGFPDVAFAPLRLVTADLLPPPIREGFSLPWTPLRRRAASAFRVTARSVRLVPGPVRRFPVLGAVETVRRLVA